MRRRCFSRTVLILALASAVASAPAFAAVEPLAEGLRRCSLETDEGKRLACFDALASAVPKIQSDQFGMTVDIARKRDPAAASRTENESLPGKITALQEAPRGEYIFTLDNGQIWIQAELRSNIRFEVGDAVQIEHGAMGSLWLAADRHRKTRVKRIQ
jgi:hypothetical protein